LSSAGRRRGARFLAAAGGTFAIYAAFLALQPVLRLANVRMLELTPWTRRFVPMRPDLPEPWADVFGWLSLPLVRTILFVAALFALFALYRLAYRAVLSGAVSRGSILLAFVAFAVVLTPSLPILAGDAFAYIAHGELVDVRGVNPYQVRMEDHRDLAAARYASHLRLGSVYGPLALRTFQALHVTTWGPFANLMILKLFFVVVLVASCELLYRTGLTLGWDESRARATLLLLAWNPLVLLDGIQNAHLDVMILGLLALGTFLTARGRTVVGLAVLATTAAVKIVFLFLAPAILFYAFASARAAGWRSGLMRAAQVAVLGTTLNLVWQLPDWTQGSPLVALSELRGYSSASLTFVLRGAFRGIGVSVPQLTIVVAGLFAGVLLWGIRRVRDLPSFLRRVSRDGLSWLLIFTAVTHPWYALPLFVPVLAAGVRRHVAALVVFSACATLSFYGMRLAMGMFTDAAKYVNFLVGVLPATIVFLGGDRIRGIRSPTAR